MPVNLTLLQKPRSAIPNHSMVLTKKNFMASFYNANLFSKANLKITRKTTANFSMPSLIPRVSHYFISNYIF